MQVETGHQSTPTARATLRRPRAGLILEVVAHCESALSRAGKNGDPELRIAREIIPDLGELVGGGNVYSVQHFRPVDSDHRQVFSGSLVVNDELIAH